MCFRGKEYFEMHTFPNFKGSSLVIKFLALAFTTLRSFCYRFVGFNYFYANFDDVLASRKTEKEIQGDVSNIASYRISWRVATKSDVILCLSYFSCYNFNTRKSTSLPPSNLFQPLFLFHKTIKKPGLNKFYEPRSVLLSEFTMIHIFLVRLLKNSMNGLPRRSPTVMTSLNWPIKWKSLHCGSWIL